VGNTGAPFERAVADAFTQLGLIAVRDGRHAAPDVVATAPLGASAFTLVAECKSFESVAPHVQWVAASEAARFRADASHPIAWPELVTRQRLEREGDLARVSQDDIRAAVTVAASSLVGAVQQTGNTVAVVSRVSMG
jgi:hypothetical protein